MPFSVSRRMDEMKEDPCKGCKTYLPPAGVKVQATFHEPQLYNPITANIYQCLAYNRYLKDRIHFKTFSRVYCPCTTCLVKVVCKHGNRMKYHTDVCPIFKNVINFLRNSTPSALRYTKNNYKDTGYREIVEYKSQFNRHYTYLSTGDFT